MLKSEIIIMLQPELIARLRNELFQADSLTPFVQDTIHANQWLRIWVPKHYNGLGFSFPEGLTVLRQLAYTDGSLGWLVTLCSGANYFSRNLVPDTTCNIFRNEKVCLGGSGTIGGTAEIVENGYLLNGFWPYASGAPYLTHFTLNATLTVNGEVVLDENDEPLVKSFVLEAKQVVLVPCWKTMGMIATSSHSFEVSNQLVSKEHSFVYNQFYTEEVLDKIPFDVFADLTLLVNYLGMTEHFLESSKAIIENPLQNELAEFLTRTISNVEIFANEVEGSLAEGKDIDDNLRMQCHEFGVTTVDNLILYFTKLYRLCGIRASRVDEEMNQVFRDFFTATQHRNFR